MKTVAEVIGVSRSNLADCLQERCKKRIGRPPLPDDELVSKIKAVVAELPTYGYRRVHAVLKRQALAAGLKPPNHKRVYRVMKVRGLLLDRDAVEDCAGFIHETVRCFGLVVEFQNVSFHLCKSVVVGNLGMSFCRESRMLCRLNGVYKRFQ